jgi:hypothetical protein
MFAPTIQPWLRPNSRPIGFTAKINEFAAIANYNEEMMFINFGPVG